MNAPRSTARRYVLPKRIVLALGWIFILAGAVLIISFRYQDEPVVNIIRAVLGEVDGLIFSVLIGLAVARAYRGDRQTIAFDRLGSDGGRTLMAAFIASIGFDLLMIGIIVTNIIGNYWPVDLAGITFALAFAMVLSTRYLKQPRFLIIPAFRDSRPIELITVIVRLQSSGWHVSTVSSLQRRYRIPQTNTQSLDLAVSLALASISATPIRPVNAGREIQFAIYPSIKKLQLEYGFYDVAKTATGYQATEQKTEEQLSSATLQQLVDESLLRSGSNENVFFHWNVPDGYENGTQLREIAQ